MYHGFRKKRTRRAHTITRETVLEDAPPKPLATDLKEILQEAKNSKNVSRRMTQVSPDKVSAAATKGESEILDLKIDVAPIRKSMVADFVPSNSLQLKAQTLLAPVH